MPTFVVPTNDDVPAWFPDFLTQLTNCFEGVSDQMDKLETGLSKLFSSKLDDLRSTVTSELSEVREVAIQARDLAQSNAKAVQALEKRMDQRMFSLERKCNALSTKNRQLTEQQEQQDTYSRKENLVIRGIDEAAAEETEDMCITAVRQMCMNNLNIDRDHANGMVIVRCHRLGKKDTSGTYKRPIIVRFLNFNDRQTVWNKRLSLKNSGLSLSENFSNGMEHRRQLLYPVMKVAKNSDKYEKAHMKGDKLVIDNVEYSAADGSLSNLPADLDPVQFSSKSDNKWIIFGGRHSTFNPLSNYYPEPMIHKNIHHDTIEHAYQYVKASRYGDKAAEEAILCSSTPAEAKQAGRTVMNFDRKDWDEVKTGIMLELLRIKFKAGSRMADFLKATTGKSLAEAGRSKSFAIGMSLHHKNIFNTRQWPKNSNILGKCLMEVRDELNK